MPQKGTLSHDRFIPLMYKGFLPAELRIVEVGGQSMESKPAIVRVDKISGNRLHFLSELLFPINPQIVFNFRVSILNETIDLKGIIHQSQREALQNLFEVVLLIDDATKSKLVTMLGNLARHFMALHLKAEYYYHYFSESTTDFKNRRINLLL
jgi:hypothetical protein